MNLLSNFRKIIRDIQSAAEGRKKIKAKVKLKEGTVDVCVRYFSKKWADKILNLTVNCLPEIESAAGFPYPRNYGIEIYQANYKDLKANDGENRGEDGIWLKPSAFDSYLVHEIAHCWTGMIDETWLMEGLADLYAYIALKNNKRHSDASTIKSGGFSEYYKYLKFPENKDFPLDGFTMENFPKNKIYYGVGKSFVFIYTIYMEYGIEIIQAANRKLYERYKQDGKMADSKDYKKAYEEVTGRNMDHLFSGWIFPGEYKVKLDEVVKKENEIKEKMKESGNRGLMSSERYRKFVKRIVENI